MTGERVVRRLAAIMAADVVGYSRLMGRDENGTLMRLKAHRTERLEPTLARHGGRLVKLTGDGALAEFSSAVDALGAAIEFQQAMSDANQGQPEDSAIVFRIGLHLGDLIVDGDDLYGDGVNVAARLEAEAPPGGIVVSRAIREAVEGRLKAKLHALGELALKNIERPIRAFRVEWDAADWPMTHAKAPQPALSVESATPALALPDKPSIAVLPFSNMSGDPEQEYFTDGITEDIITELSRFRSLFVIARNSSFSYKGKSPDLRQVGRDLGVRYVLEGSIRRASNRVRVTAQLIDTLTGSHIWAERYDRVLEDIFAVQEEVTLAIVAAIAPQIESTELSKASRRRPDNLSAYEIALRARAHALEAVGKADQTLLERSMREAREALAIDPDSVQALQALAYSYGAALLLRSTVDPEYAFGQATWAATRAIELDGTDASSYALRSLAVLRGRQFDRYADALADVRRAHQMNPNHTDVLRILAALETGVGEPERSIEHALQVLRLNPRDPHIHITYNLLAWASFGAKQYAEGVGWASRAINNMPKMIQVHTCYVTCLVGTGAIAKAKAAFEAFQKLAPPEYVQSGLEGSSLYARPEDRTRSVAFLRVAAGLEDPSAADALR
jgi:TolB-like protein/class 3 adenylate cyclase